MSSRNSSVSRSSSPTSLSTAPSTPNHSQPRYFVLCASPDQDALKLIPLRAGSEDKLLLLTGSGVRHDLLLRAATLIGQRDLFDDKEWETVDIQGTNITYWWTGDVTSATPGLPKKASELLEVLTKSALVSTLAR